MTNWNDSECVACKKTPRYYDYEDAEPWTYGRCPKCDVELKYIPICKKGTSNSWQV